MSLVQVEGREGNAGHGHGIGDSMANPSGKMTRAKLIVASLLLGVLR